MAQPKELKSAYSARPEALPNRIPAQEDFSDIAEDFSDIAEIPPTTKVGIPIEQQGTEFGSMAEAEAAAQAMIPSRGTVADIGASLVTQVPARLAAGVAGTAVGGPLAGYLAQQTAGAGAAYFEKDVANAFRRAIGAPEDQDRDRATDIAMSFLFDIPGAGVAATQALEGLISTTGRTAMRSGKAMVKSLPIELQSSLATLKSSIQNEMGQYLSAEEAAKQVANLEDDFVGLLRQGYSPKQAGASVTRKYSFQVRSNQAKTDLLQSVGPELSAQDFQKVITRPQAIIEMKRARAGQQQKVAFEAIKQTKGLDQIDTSVMVSDLTKALNEARGIGDKDLAKSISNVIDGISERSKLKTQFNDLAAFNEATGGKVPRLIEVSKTPPVSGASEISIEQLAPEIIQGSTAQPGFQVGPSLRGRRGVEDTLRTTPSVTTTTEFFPATVKRGEKEVGQLGFEISETPVMAQDVLTPDEQAARLLPPKISDANENFVMQSIDSLIEKRMAMDARIPQIKNEEKKLAMIRAVSALRNIEDQFMSNLRNKGGRYAEVADRYMTAKQSYYQVADAIENMGAIVREDAVGVARMLDASKPEEIAAWSAVMPKDVKDSVARRYVEGILDMQAGMPDRPYTMEQFKKIESALSDSYKQNKLGQLIGSQRAQQASQDIKNLSRLVQAASSLPVSAGPENQLIRRLFIDLERLSKKWGLNAIYSGRMAFDPDSRAYRDFLNYVMSKDFAGTVRSVSEPSEIASAGAELTRVFGKNHPMTNRFYNFVQSSGMLPYAAGVAGQAARAYSNQ